MATRIRFIRPRLAAALAAIAVGVAVFAAPSAAQAEVLVTNDAYVANAQEVFSSPAGGGVLANDVNADLNWSMAVFRSPMHGKAVAVGAGGSFTYRPDDGFVGADSFDYCVTAKPGVAPCLSAPATVFMTVQSSVHRIGGADRFAVSADMSARTYAPGSAIAYVVSGQVFPDALSASASAGKRGGPVLLVTKDTIPRPIADELLRLKPQQIVVVGGVNTISNDVQTSLGLYSANVARIAGADRYEVSANVSADSFSAFTPTVYVASGANFPDALSGSAAAGNQGAPVLLVQKDQVPGAVATELARLDPVKIIVLGGRNSVSDAVVAELTRLTKSATATRVDGADRFAVSAAASASAFTVADTHTVYVASGETFPDALSGSAVAINAHAPVLLVAHDSVPKAIADELTRLDPTRIVVLGGPNTVSAGTLDALKAFLVK